MYLYKARREGVITTTTASLPHSNISQLFVFKYHIYCAVLTLSNSSSASFFLTKSIPHQLARSLVRSLRNETGDWRNIKTEAAILELETVYRFGKL